MSQWLDEIREKVEQEGPEWLSRIRSQSLLRFREFDWPDRKVENWKYTSLAHLRGKPLLLPAGDAQATPEYRALSNGPRMVFLNGRPIIDESKLQGLPEGVLVSDLEEYLQGEVAESVRSAMEQLYDTRDAAPVLLNSATARHGMVVIVPDALQAGSLECIYLSSSASDACSPIRNIIILGENAELELIEQFVSLDEGEGVANVMTQVELGQQASLEHTRLQDCGEQHQLLNRLDARCHASADYRYHGLDLGGSLVRHDLNIELLGENASTSLNGAYAISGKSHVDNHSRIEHIAPACRSSEVFKGIIGDKAHAVFNGKVKVHQGADDSEAHQKNANVLLSPHAEVDTKPELEIHADEVVCSHGATVGQMDETALFYLRSRGIARDKAEIMLNAAFCQEAIDGISDENLKNRMQQRLDAKLALLTGA